MGVQDSEYRTDILQMRPWIYADKIASMEHFNQILDYYVMNRHDNNIRNIPWEELIRFGSLSDKELDANYITSPLWQFLLPELDEKVADDLASGTVVYNGDGDLNLVEEDITQLKRFNISYYIPRAQIVVDVKRNDQNVHVVFEYDFSLKKGGNFVYGL
jgi:hypothetical protein